MHDKLDYTSRHSKLDEAIPSRSVATAELPEADGCWNLVSTPGLGLRASLVTITRPGIVLMISDRR